MPHHQYECALPLHQRVRPLSPPASAPFLSTSEWALTLHQRVRPFSPPGEWALTLHQRVRPLSPPASGPAVSVKVIFGGVGFVDIILSS